MQGLHHSMQKKILRLFCIVKHWIFHLRSIHFFFWIRENWKSLSFSLNRIQAGLIIYRTIFRRVYIIGKANISVSIASTDFVYHIVSWNTTSSWKRLELELDKLWIRFDESNYMPYWNRIYTRWLIIDFFISPFVDRY